LLVGQPTETLAGLAKSELAKGVGMTRLDEFGHGEANRLPSRAGIGRASGAVAVERPPFRPGEIYPIDLQRLLNAFRRRFLLFASVSAAVIVAVGAGTLLSTPKYRATAEVLLDPRNEKITKADDVLSGLPADSTVVDSEVEVLRSPQLAERVVKLLKLDQDPEFTRDLGRQPGPLSGKPLQQVVNTVRKNLDVNRSGLTYVIDIAFRSQSPAKAVKIADEFANLYLAQQVQDKLDATEHAVQWLDTRLEQLRTQVLADDTAVQQFKIANNLMSSQGATLTEQEISNYNQTLGQASAQMAADQARLDTAERQLATGSNGDDVGEALDSPTIGKLKEQRAVVSRQVAALQAQFGDEYPKLKDARSELADIDAEIGAETHRIISNLDAKAQVSRRRANAIQATLGVAQGGLAANNRASVRLSELERNLEASRALYESYLTRYKETSTQEGLAQPDARIVSLAPLPTKPSSPNVPLNLLIGAAFAFGAGLGAVGLAEMLDSGIATAADVERRFSLKYLGAVPLLSSIAKRSKLAPVDYVVSNPWSSLSEAFRGLRAAIMHGPGPAPRTVAVTSALPGDGKTTTAVGLGRSAALQGLRVVIVDCDLRHGNLQRFANAAGRYGLLAVLAGKTKLARALVRDSATDMDILPVGHGPISTKDVFGSRPMDDLLADLSSHYDLVILDTPPVLAVADSRILARKADFTVLVARWRATPHQAIEGALRVLHSDGIAVGGMLLNQVDMAQQSRYGYGDTAYYKAYSHYYLEPPDASRSSDPP
jgi:capsular exopolysaccharide synthesis family protein